MVLLTKVTPIGRTRRKQLAGLLGDVLGQHVVGVGQQLEVTLYSKMKRTTLQQ